MELADLSLFEDFAPCLRQSHDFASTDEITEKAMTILREVMQFRRMAQSASACSTSCDACLAPHLPQVVSAILNNKPITFVLPAFPGKSPNLAKVLGPLPDLAEQRSLEFLQFLCERVQRLYTPGAKVILCSDGRVFSDAVGLKESDVSAYQHELSQMIEENSLTSLSTFNLDDVYLGLSFDKMREELMKTYGKSLENLKAMVQQGQQEESPQAEKEMHRLYCGITRFLFEDALSPGQTKSRASIQKDARFRAYKVIQRSNAWSELLAELFPEAVRLSIHPQGCGSRKLGIRLLEGESWMTPWHGVAVEMGGRFHLMKRSEAEELGAALVQLEGKPSHFKLTTFAGRRS